MANALSVIATSGAAIVVPLLYVPSLALPFTLPKQIAFEIAAVLGLGALALRFAAGGPAPANATNPGAAPPAPGSLFAVGLPVACGAALVLISVAVSAVIATRTQLGAPYALAVLGRWAALFGVAVGVAAGGGTSASRARILQAVTASAAIVSAIGLLQHVEPLLLPIPVISAPGSTFGNRNLGAEAVALAIPMGLGALALAQTRWERRAFAVAVALEFLYLAATRARGAWLGGAAGVLTVVIAAPGPWTRRVVIPAVAVGALALVVALLPGRTNNRDLADSKRLARGMDVVEASFDPGSTALRTRRGLWRRSLAMFRTAPLTGVGPGNWPVLFPRHAEPGATADGVLHPTLSPRHAHDDVLEHLAETGLLGLAALLTLGAGVVVTARRRLRHGDSELRGSTSAAAGTLVALVGAGITGFPMEMPATLVLAGLALGSIASGETREDAGSEWPAWPDSGWIAAALAALGWIAAALAALVLAVMVVGAERRIRGSYWLAVAESALRAEPGVAGAARAWDALDRSNRANPGEFQVALRRAHAALRLRRLAEAAAAAEEALTREPFSPNAWATLAEAQLLSRDPRSAGVSAERSLALLHDYPFALFVRARAAEAAGDPDGAGLAWARLALLASSASADADIVRSSRDLLRARVPVRVSVPDGEAPPDAAQRR